MPSLTPNLLRDILPQAVREINATTSRDRYFGSSSSRYLSQSRCLYAMIQIAANHYEDAMVRLKIIVIVSGLDGRVVGLNVHGQSIC